jgi:hypothetical protein
MPVTTVLYFLSAPTPVGSTSYFALGTSPKRFLKILIKLSA